MNAIWPFVKMLRLSFFTNQLTCREIYVLKLFDTEELILR